MNDPVIDREKVDHVINQVVHESFKQNQGQKERELNGKYSACHQSTPKLPLFFLCLTTVCNLILLLESVNKEVENMLNRNGCYPIVTTCNILICCVTGYASPIFIIKLHRSAVRPFSSLCAHKERTVIIEKLSYANYSPDVSKCCWLDKNITSRNGE